MKPLWKRLAAGVIAPIWVASFVVLMPLALLFTGLFWLWHVICKAYQEVLDDL